jgi:hypothetical protein
LFVCLLLSILSPEDVQYICVWEASSCGMVPLGCYIYTEEASCILDFDCFWDSGTCRELKYVTSCVAIKVLFVVLFFLLLLVLFMMFKQFLIILLC